MSALHSAEVAHPEGLHLQVSITLTQERCLARRKCWYASCRYVLSSLRLTIPEAVHQHAAPGAYKYASRLKKLTDQAEGVTAQTGPVHALTDGLAPKFGSVAAIAPS
jgi:hypothetical protein